MKKQPMKAAHKGILKVKKMVTKEKMEKMEEPPQGKKSKKS